MKSVHLCHDLTSDTHRHHSKWLGKKFDIEKLQSTEVMREKEGSIFQKKYICGFKKYLLKST